MLKIGNHFLAYPNKKIPQLPIHVKVETLLLFNFYRN